MGIRGHQQLAAADGEVVVTGQTVDGIGAGGMHDGKVIRPKVDHHIIARHWQDAAAPVQRVVPVEVAAGAVPGDSAGCRPVLEYLQPGPASTRSYRPAGVTGQVIAERLEPG